MKILSILLLFVFSFSAFSQITELEKKLIEKKVREDGWLKGGLTTLTFSQTSLTNWSAGGQDAITVNGLVNLFAYYKKGNGTWDNTLDIGYGMIKQFEQGTFSQVNWIKNDDKLDFASKYGQKAFKSWYYAGMLNFKSQMTPGFAYPANAPRARISNFMAPAYLLGAVGMDYKPNDNLTLFFAPLTSKTTFVIDDSLSNAGAFGVEAATYDTAGLLLEQGKRIRSEVGGYIKILYKTELFKNISLQTKADLFSNYLNNPQYIDVNWETLIGLKVNKFITVNITTHLIYDYDIKFQDDNGNETEKVQFKEVFGVGFSYKF